MYAHRGAQPGWNPINLIKRSEISSVVSSALPPIAPGVEGTYKQDLAAIAKNSKFRINNFEDKFYPPLTPNEIRDRINTVKPPYNGLTENCETFCHWARNNLYLSGQIQWLLSTLVGVYLTYCVFRPLLSNLLPTWLLPFAAPLVMFFTVFFVFVSLQIIVINYQVDHNIILPVTIILPTLHLLYMLYIYWMFSTNLPISLQSVSAAVISVCISHLGGIFITSKLGYSDVTAGILVFIVIPVITNMILPVIPTTIVTSTAAITIAMLYHNWVTIPGSFILHYCANALPVLFNYQH